MSLKLPLLGTLSILLLALLATAAAADEENRLFLPAVSGGVANAVTWTPTATSTSTITATPTPTDQTLPPDDLIDCSNPDFTSLPVCQGGATPTPTPGGTIP